MPTMSLTDTQAFSLLVLYCIIYVAPLYVFPSTRPYPNRTRDHPDNIRARIQVVSFSTAVCSLVTFLILCSAKNGTETADDPWHLMGYWPPGPVDAGRALLLTCLLFAAPLYEYLLVDGGWEEWTDLQPLRNTWSQWTYWRNYAAGPVTEECLFRSASIPLLIIGGVSATRIMFLSPLVFGLAHLHHFYEFRLTNPRVPVAAAVVRSLIQLTYTTLFGAYENFLYLRTGSLLAVIVVHTFCNGMGLPRVWGVLRPSWLSETQLQQPAATLGWTALYYILLFGGAIGWWSGLYILTESSGAVLAV